MTTAAPVHEPGDGLGYRSGPCPSCRIEAVYWYETSTCSGKYPWAAAAGLGDQLQ
jgi:hypothetical protein